MQVHLRLKKGEMRLIDQCNSLTWMPVLIGTHWAACRWQLQLAGDSAPEMIAVLITHKK